MSENLDDPKTKCFKTINDLFEKYQGNEYMTQRIHNHIVNYLSNTLANECKNNEDRINRNNYLSNEQQVFIQVFLSKNKYFYLTNNNFFYEYDDEKYLIATIKANYFFQVSFKPTIRLNTNAPVFESSLSVTK